MRFVRVNNRSKCTQHFHTQHLWALILKLQGLGFFRFKDSHGPSQDLVLRGKHRLSTPSTTGQLLGALEQFWCIALIICWSHLVPSRFSNIAVKQSMTVPSSHKHERTELFPFQFVISLIVFAGWSAFLEILMCKVLKPLSSLRILDCYRIMLYCFKSSSCAKTHVVLSRKRWMNQTWCHKQIPIPAVLRSWHHKAWHRGHLITPPGRWHAYPWLLLFRMKSPRSPTALQILSEYAHIVRCIKS